MNVSEAKVRRRSTAQKQVILQTLRELGSHVSAGAVYARLCETHPEIGRATVYRVLSDMAQDGLLLRIHTGGADDKFDVTATPHWHITCRLCGKVDDMELDLVPRELLDHVTGSSGYRVDDVNAEFLGICPACRKKLAEEQPAGQTDQNYFNNTKENPIMKKWRCTICGEIVESDVRPDKCPLCKAPGEKFEEVAEEGMTWAAEHVVGVAKDAPAEIVEGLRANFNGECTEVGMYLAMSRVAFREGYPEIGLYWEKAAFEEAEHAAKFAELLGEVVTDSTKTNLELRVAAENGATAGKFELAKLAKEKNLDAIHDTVHEMAKDEARHGRAFKGLLERYFG